MTEAAAPTPDDRAPDASRAPHARAAGRARDAGRELAQARIRAGRSPPSRPSSRSCSSWAGYSAGGRADLASAEVREGPFRVSIIEAGTLQALRSVTYASTIQSNQAKIVALAPEGKLVQKGDLLVLFDAAPFEEEIRRNQALLAQAEADLAKAREDLKLQAIQNREELLAAELRVEKNDLELKDVQQGKGRVKEEEAAQAVANAERELQKARDAARRPASAAAGGLHHAHRARACRAAGGARTRGPRAGPPPQGRARRLRPTARAQPGALRRAVEPRDAAPARERRPPTAVAAEAGRDRRRAEPDPGGRGAARAREAAARALRGARRRARDRGLQGRLLRLRAEEAPGGRPGLGQPAAHHPARHLADGGRDARARDRRAQGRAQPEGRPCAWRPTPTCASPAP